MTEADKLIFEDSVMRLAMLMHSLAVSVNPDARNRRYIDGAWVEFKIDMGKRFGKWREPYDWEQRFAGKPPKKCPACASRNWRIKRPTQPSVKGERP